MLIYRAIYFIQCVAEIVERDAVCDTIEQPYVITLRLHHLSQNGDGYIFIFFRAKAVSSLTNVSKSCVCICSECRTACRQGGNDSIRAHTNTSSGPIELEQNHCQNVTKETGMPNLSILQEMENTCNSQYIATVSTTQTHVN